MDSRTGKIVEMTGSMQRLFEQNGKIRHMVPLTEEEDADLRQIPVFRRKNHMRNQPCKCGSGRKFKKCCWGKFA